MLSRILVYLVTIAALTPGAALLGAAEQGQLDSDITLFTVLAAVNVGGYDAGLDSPSGSPVRLAMRRDLKTYQGSRLEQLRNFYAQHKVSDPVQDLAQYISFALQCSGPPEFKFRMVATEISPDVQPLAGFSGILADFFREAEIDKLYAKYQPEFEKEIERYHEPVTQAVWEANGYLRVPTSGYLGRRFQIYIDLLSAPNSPSVRGYGPNVYVILHPSRDLRTREVRHAYLHYLLDPYSSKYAAILEEKKQLASLAMYAPALDDSYKTDFALLVTESLIKAVEARTRRASEQQKQSDVDQAVREGFILTAHFYEQLARYEAQEQGIRLYYPELLNAIDLKKEDRRLRRVNFAERPPDRKPASDIARLAPPPLTGLAKTLDDAEQSLSRRELDQARVLFLQAQQESDNKDARALYGLARLAALEKDPERAKELFRQALDASPDAHVRGMSHIYLGRIEDLFGNREQAVEHYKEALAAGDPAQGTREAAEKGLKESFTSPKSE